jgi:hypothetical protein
LPISLAAPVSGTLRRWRGFIPEDGSIVNIAKILPMAFVMIAGPQILSAIFLATSEAWRRDSAAYLAGAALSVTPIVTIAFLASTGRSRRRGLERHARYRDPGAARRRGGAHVRHA